MSEHPFMREGMHIDSDITLYEMSAGGGKMRIVNPVTLVAGVTYRIDYTEVGPGEVRVDAKPVASLAEIPPLLNYPQTFPGA